MAQCPVCGTEYSQGKLETCSTCNWDLTSYPSTLDKIPDIYKRKEEAKLSWAQAMWKQKKLIETENDQLGNVNQANQSISAKPYSFVIKALSFLSLVVIIIWFIIT